MYAIIESGGKQYRVSEGDVVRVEKINAAVGSTVVIDKVLMLGGEKIYVGTPVVDGAVVSCKVLQQDKEKKILVFHYKAKKNIRKRYGHRQPFTSLLVESISREGKAPKQTKPAETETAVSEVKPAKKEVVKETAETATVKKAAAKKTDAAATTAEKPAKKTATSAKKTEIAATAEEKPMKKTAARSKKTETED